MCIDILKINGKNYSLDYPNDNPVIVDRSYWADYEVFVHFYLRGKIFELSDDCKTVVKCHKDWVSFLRDIVGLRWKIKNIFNDTAKVIILEDQILVYNFDIHGEDNLSYYDIEDYKEEVELCA